MGNRLMHATLIHMRGGTTVPNAEMSSIAALFDARKFSAIKDFNAEAGDYFAWRVDSAAVPYFAVEEVSVAAVDKNWEYFFSTSADQPNPIVFTGTHGEAASVIAHNGGAAGLYAGTHQTRTAQPTYDPSGPPVYLILRAKAKASSAELVRNG